MHVAKIERRTRGRVYRSYLLRRTYREDGRVKHETLGNLSHLPEPTIELIRRALRGETLVAPDDAFDIVRTRPHGHVAAVLGTLRRLDLERLLARTRSRERDLVVAMIVARVLDPRSKLATARGLDAASADSSLGEAVGVAAAEADALYAAMDWLLPRQGRIEQALAKRHLTEGTLVLYDVTSVYFEGRSCPLVRFGKSRDGKRDKPQIVFGLLCTAQGCPVAVEVFEGNTGDPTTLAPQVEKIRARFGIQRVVWVGDRGLLTPRRIQQELRPVEGLEWITALRAPAIRKLVESGSLQLSLFDETDLGEICDPAYPGERLVVCRNPLLAEERARKREALLQATERELDAIVAATRRTKRRLRGKAQIGLRVGKVLGRFKMAKHFRLVIEEEGFRYERDAEHIAQEAALDGIYVLRTSVPAEELGTEDTVRAYKGLSAVERAFRSLKTVDLRVRPVHHRNADRVRCHVLLCMLAYYVEWHMRRALAPMLFEDDDPAGGEALRASVVAPAQRSPRAQQKLRTKRTEEGFPVHSFQTLLADLATLAKNTIQPRVEGSATFDQFTRPTPLQQRALELLGVRYRT
jgi:hypothetical protein